MQTLRRKFWPETLSTPVVDLAPIKSPSAATQTNWQQAATLYAAALNGAIRRNDFETVQFNARALEQLARAAHLDATADEAGVVRKR